MSIVSRLQFIHESWQSRKIETSAEKIMIAYAYVFGVVVETTVQAFDNAKNRKSRDNGVAALAIGPDAFERAHVVAVELDMRKKNVSNIQ